MERERGASLRRFRATLRLLLWLELAVGLAWLAALVVASALKTANDVNGLLISMAHLGITFNLVALRKDLRAGMRPELPAETVIVAAVCGAGDAFGVVSAAKTLATAPGDPVFVYFVVVASLIAAETLLELAWALALVARHPARASITLASDEASA